MTAIYHMADRDDWQAAKAAGVYHGTEDDLIDGFIHFSTAGTVAASAAKHRAGQGNLVLIRVRSEALGPDLRWEPARGGVLFPHLYAPLLPSLVYREDDLPLGPDGLHVFPELE